MLDSNRTNNSAALFVLLVVALYTPAQATEYFVSKQGNDANDGLSKADAFETIQKGVNELKPGDTLTIAPGEYFESVKRERLGGPDTSTIIRAEIPGTAVIRGDVPAPEFKKVDGYRFIYAAKTDRAPNAIFEHNRIHVLTSKSNIAELDFDPGFFHHDARNGMLYVSNYDLSPVDQCHYTMSVNASERGGLELARPERVIVDGLAATGFYPRYGIWLKAPVSCIVRNCVCYMNVKGIEMAPIGIAGRMEAYGSNNIIENCVCYGNSFGGVTCYTGDNDTIRNCYCYRNGFAGEHFGVMHYFKAEGPLLIQNNITWGHSFNLSVKPSTGERLERNVGLGYIRNAGGNMSHNLIAGGNEFDRGLHAPAHNILFARERNLDKDFEFADHLNLDFHLQPDSRFRKSAPDGSDRGPHQYKPNIFYVSPNGDDTTDGLSMRKPWRTLARALKRIRPGDTVYLTEGRYTAAALGGARSDGKKPIRILGRGRGAVVLEDVQTVTGGDGIEFERVNFPNGVALRSSRNVKFKNCTFYGDSDGLQAESVENLRIDHSVFAGAPVNVRNSSGVFLSANIYVNSGEPAVRVDNEVAILYSDYNDYQDETACWSINGTICSLADVRMKQHDRYSRTLTPKLAMENGVPSLQNKNVFKSVGPCSTAMGIFHSYEAVAKPFGTIGPFVHRVSDTTANVEWWATANAQYELAWGETPAMKNRISGRRSRTRFNTYSLSGLKPGTKYYFKIARASSFYRSGPEFSVIPKNAEVTFATDGGHAEPRTYYVAPDGNDGNRRHQYVYGLCPEMEDVNVDIFHYLSEAYAHTGQLDAAEEVLKAVNDNRFQQQYTAGEAVHDLAWLRLGDFYKKWLKDDKRALEAYLKVCSRTTWARFGTPQKPASTGASDTLVEATGAACEILRKEGRSQEVKKWQQSLKEAQAQARVTPRR